MISFRYEPSYLKNGPDLRTDFRKDLAPQLGLPVTYSNINLDDGNMVFSPSGACVLISDRVFSENPEYPPAALVHELSELLEAEVLIIKIKFDRFFLFMGARTSFDGSKLR